MSGIMHRRAHSCAKVTCVERWRKKEGRFHGDRSVLHEMQGEASDEEPCGESDEERQADHEGNLPRVRHDDLPHRLVEVALLVLSFGAAKEGPSPRSLRTEPARCDAGRRGGTAFARVSAHVGRKARPSRRACGLSTIWRFPTTILPSSLTNRTYERTIMRAVFRKPLQRLAAYVVRALTSAG